jgi:hypothetical protein
MIERFFVSLSLSPRVLLLLRFVTPPQVVVVVVVVAVAGNEMESSISALIKVIDNSMRVNEEARGCYLRTKSLRGLFPLFFAEDQKRNFFAKFAHFSQTWIPVLIGV